MTTSWFDGKARIGIGETDGQGLNARDQWPPNLQMAFELVSASDLPCMMILRDGLLVFGNGAASRIVSGSTVGLEGQSLAEAGLEDLELPIRKVLHTGRSVVCHAQPTSGVSGVRRHFDAYLSPVADEEGTTLAVLCALTPPLDSQATSMNWTPGSSRSGADNGQLPSTLLSEMKHRVKNILSMVQAIARLTLGVDQNPAYDAFEARILALARTQDLITREPADSVDLRDLLALILAPHPRNAIDTAGPPMRISSNAAVTLSLGIHELATNALKYGALSVETGHVLIRWTAPPRVGEPMRITWTESGGPKVRPPMRKGFGTVLIETIMAGELQGEVVLSFEPTGLVCTITANQDVVRGPADSLATG